MKTKVFLSLSYTDADFVRSVKSRLPFGVALFYEQSFENFENLVDAMDRTTSRASVFCFFINKHSVNSKAVGFEIDKARHAEIFKDNVKILVFPTDAEVTFDQLPMWMREYWVPKAGYGPNDIARHITSLLLDMDGSGASRGLIGRGKALDHLDALVSDFMQTRAFSPRSDSAGIPLRARF
jgi:hypothetical protein